jgi:type VI secretion system secreted protein VgrG
MPEFTQAHREITFRMAGISQDAVAFKFMRGRERLGRPFRFEVDFSCLDHPVAAEDMLDKPATLSLRTAYGQREFNGIVTRFDVVDQGNATGRYGNWTAYRAEMRPQLWRLAYSSRCRFFYNKTVPQIAQQLLQDSGVAARIECGQGYAALSHCAQYRESDLDFLNRLLQREGIYYYFEHRDGTDTVVLCDGSGSHPALEGYGPIPFDALLVNGLPVRESVYRWRSRAATVPGASRTNTFDFRNVAASTQGQFIEKAAGAEQANSYGVDDYAPRYAEVGNVVDLGSDDFAKGGDNRRRLARVHLETREAAAAVAHGESNVRGISPGWRFQLSGHPCSDQNDSYLITEARYRLAMDSDSVDGAARTFHCRFKAIRARQAFRSRPWTAIPRAGLQTATVVAPRGDPYAADKHGRIKVQFHWETFNASEADASQRAWVRVAQGWAGRKWGAMFLPRAGQEVVVAFLDGDPDHPIVVGSLYNNVNAPPFDLPAHGGISTLRTASLGEDASERNELRFNDKDMQVLVYTDGRCDSYVKKDQLAWVGNDSHLIVDGEQRIHVHEQHLTIAGDQNSDVGRNSWMTVKQNVVRHAGGSVLIKGDLSVVVEADLGVSLKSGGSFVSVTPAGVEISGDLVQVNGELVRMKGTAIMLNCGPAAGAGAAKPPPGPASGPHQPDKADDGSKFI